MTHTLAVDAAVTYVAELCKQWNLGTEKRWPPMPQNTLAKPAANRPISHWFFARPAEAPVFQGVLICFDRCASARRLASGWLS